MSVRIGTTRITGNINFTKETFGLENVTNTSDADKPVSTAQQAALDTKVDIIVGKALSTNDYSTAEKTKLSGIATGAQVNVPTNLSIGTLTTTTVPINSSTGTNIALASATTTLAGVMSAADKVKLDASFNYTHPTTDGSLHVPATSTTNSGKVLTAGATAGSISWVYPTVGTVTNVTGSGAISVASGTTTPVVSIAAASATVPGTMSAADYSKLVGVAAGAQVNVATNIAQGTRTATSVPVTSSTGSNAALDIATTALAGVMSAADKVKLDGVATSANNYIHPNHSGDVTSVADGVTTISSKAVTLAKLADMATASFIGRNTAATGVPEVLSTATVKTMLGLGSAAYVNTGAASGNVPILDTNGKLLANVMPSFALTETNVVASQAAMLALSNADIGDVAVRTDLNKTFILKASGYSVLANWQELLTPADAVSSVAGRTGAVTLSNADISGLGTMSTQNSTAVNITGGSITGITDIAVANGGTGASDAATARTNLGVAIGSNVQAYSGQLTNVAALAVTDGNFMVGNGTTWIAESGSTARTSLGLGTLATQNSTAVAITGGTITGITDLAVADGGTGSSTAAGAKTNLGFTTKYATNIGDGTSTSIAISHGMGTKDVIVRMYNNSLPYDEVFTDMQYTSTSVVTAVFAVAPTAAQYRVVVIG